MVHADRILAVAVAEMRSARRLVRTWMFTFVAILLGLGGYGQQVFFHALGSGQSLTIGGLMSPRFVVVNLGAQMVWVLMLALVFLAFDIRARDRRERMDEVLDARPVDNFEMLAGRALGLVLVGWLPLAVIAALIVGFGALANLAGWWVSAGIEPYSMLTMLFIDAPATLALWCALMILTAVALRNRLLVALVGLGLFGLYALASFRLPVYLIAGFLGFGDVTRMPSDLAPVFLSAPSALHRLSFLALAGGLLAFAAVLHPRPDGAGRNGGRLLGGAVAIFAGAVGIGVLVATAVADMAERRAWAAAHAAALDAPTADLTSLTGSVVIEPGTRLALDIEAVLAAPDEAADTLVFSFNPGMDIAELSLDGEPADYRFEDGLLAVAAPPGLIAGQRLTLALRAEGMPDIRFAYLDSAVDPLAMRPVEGGAAMLLGFLPALFDDDYAALMPGIRWLPMPGASVGLDAPNRGRDFFALDLEVQAPDGWLVAGPGKRRPAAGGDAARVLFSPDAPVPAVGLFAAPFERMAMEVSGVTLELLVSPAHAENLAYLFDAKDELAERVGELLDEAAKAGLPYPYDGFSLVELPMGVRSYTGGWRMDTALALPGVMLMPEAGLPLARFEWHLRDQEQFEGGERGLAEAKVDVLHKAMRNDFGGANALAGGARNFLLFQTGATGPGAVAIDFVLGHLANSLLVESEEYFSAHGLQAQMTTAIGMATASVFTGGFGGGSVMAALRDQATNRPSVWDRIAGEALADLDVDTDPAKALNALNLRATAAARSILDALGRERTLALLAELRRRYRGANFTAEEFEAVAAELGSDLRPVLGDWLRDAAMPGFLVSNAQTFRLTDGDDGQPRYQTLVHVRNGEPAPGIFRLTARVAASGEAAWRSTDPVRIEGDAALEVGLVTAHKPQELTLAFHLALNRRNLWIELPEIDDAGARDLEPLHGPRPSDWRPPITDDLVIDDLDPGFSVEYPEGKEPAIGEGFAFAVGGLAMPDMDEGLPEFSPLVPSGAWMRHEMIAAWGKYRRTFARVRGSDGAARAIFAASLPSSGRWRLEYHMPSDARRRSESARQISAGGATVRMEINTGGGGRDIKQGPYDMQLVAGEEEPRVIEFDGSVAEPGWNRLQDFDLDAGEVRLIVANKGDFDHHVLADAIRWIPLDAPATH